MNQKWFIPRVLRVSDNRADRVRLALELAEVAGEISRRYFAAPDLSVHAKTDGSPITRADREIELAMREAVADAFPADSFTGEEYPDTQGTSAYRWIVDPIDGTKSFIRGVPLYANLIAVQEGDEIVFGLINLPSANTLVHAERGGGCWRNGTPARVSRHDALDGAYVMATWLEDWDSEIIDGLHTQGAVLRTWGDAFGYAMVACGHADAVVDYRAQPYDLAPMPVIIEEAGGRFTSLDSRRVFDAGNGIASNGLLHDTLLSHVGSETPERQGIPL